MVDLTDRFFSASSENGKVIEKPNLVLFTEKGGESGESGSRESDWVIPKLPR